MARLRHLFTGQTPGIRVRVYQVDPDWEGAALPPSFYLACETCGACSHAYPDEQEVCKRALDHAEGHETRTT